MRKKWQNLENGRYYQAELYQDLLGDWIVMRSWRGKSHRGNQMQTVLQSQADGIHEISRIDNIRTRHGYRPVGQ